MQTGAVRVTWTAQADLARHFDKRPSQRVIRHAGSTIGEEESGTARGGTQAISKFCVALQSVLRGRMHGNVSCKIRSRASVHATRFATLRKTSRSLVSHPEQFQILPLRSW